MKHSSFGFTLIEILITIAISATVFISVAKGIVLLLSARDEEQGREEMLRSAKQILSIFSQTGQTSTRFDVTDTNTKLSAKGNPCRLLVYTAATTTLGYAEDSSSNCSPPTNPTTNLNSAKVAVTSLQFLPLPQASDAKNVQLTFTLQVKYPLSTISNTFTTTIGIWGK